MTDDSLPRATQQPHARRRSEQAYGMAELLHDAVFGSLDWPDKTIRLQPDTATEQRQRVATKHPALAELYHENSKLTYHSLPRLSLPLTSADEFREAASAARAPDPDLRLEQLTLPSPFGTLMARASDRAPAALFYAVELRVLFRQRLAGWDPLSGELSVLRRLTASQMRSVAAALYPQQSQTLNSDSPLVFLAGWFAREDLLLGARGYRRVLLQSGRAVEALVSVAVELNLVAEPVYEFLDRHLDVALGFDGIEQATVAAVGLRRE